MVHLTPDELHELMRHPANIRNINFVGHHDVGKSPLYDFLAQEAGIKVRETGTEPLDADEATQHNGRNNILSHPLYAQLSSEEARSSVDSKPEAEKYLINLVCSFDQANPLPNFGPALRITDGTVIVVDCTEDISTHTESVLRQAIRERHVPSMVIDNVDRILSASAKMGAETIYQSLSRMIEYTNGITPPHTSTSKIDMRLSPATGTVIFGSSDHGWAFTLRQFAGKYANKFGVDEQKLVKRLWGENYFDSGEKKWHRIGSPEQRAFSMFVLGPISKIYDAFKLGNAEELLTLAAKLHVELTEEEKVLSATDLMRTILQRFLPAVDALTELMILNLPSPVAAQKYRAEMLYQGSPDTAAYIGMENCDPASDLVLFVSNMIPISERGRFYGIGRVFSGTVRPGLKVRLLGPNYVIGRKADLFVKSIGDTVFMMGDGRPWESFQDVPAGNLVGLVGIDQFLLNSGTITTSEIMGSLKLLKPSSPPTVQCSVDVKMPKDLPKLVANMRNLAQSDPCITVSMEDSGNHVIGGMSTSHLEAACGHMAEQSADIRLTISDPYTAFRETVQQKSSMAALSKSPNKHSRFWVEADPLGEELSRAIEGGDITFGYDSNSVGTRAKQLVNDYEWDSAEAKQLWAFGPESSGANVVVEKVRYVRNMNEIRDSFVSGFQWASKEGPLAEEPMRSIRFKILEATLFSDAIHRGAGQIIPTARRVLYAATLLAEPALQEPVYLVDIQAPEEAYADIVRSSLRKARGRIDTEEQFITHAITATATAHPNGDVPPMMRWKAYVPVLESFGLAGKLSEATEGRARFSTVLSTWQIFAGGSPLDPITESGKLVTSIRKRKGLAEELPAAEKYYDKL